MRYQPLNNTFYKANRARLAKMLKPNSVAILNSNDLMPTNADGTMKFRQNNDLFYLSGIDQEETILLICPDFPNETMQELLFVRETNAQIAVWEGNKLTQQEAAALSGVKTVRWTSEFDQVLHSILSHVEHIYLNTNEHRGAANEVETRDARFTKKLKAGYPLHRYERLAPLMGGLRAIKAPDEVEQLQRACDITEKGFRRVLDFVKPGVKEYEIEAEYLHEFVRNGSRGFGYEPIVGSGANSCVLHYLENDQVCQSGDLILMDVGAEYGNYNADMTRTIPVNGRYTSRQRDVYDAVLRVMSEAEKMLRPGVKLQEYQKEIGTLIEGELIGLSVLDRHEVSKQDPTKPLYRKYFMHGTSHPLGLDVHDVGSAYEPVKPGMVFTIEPGIYIREEAIGIRLENNYVIGEKGNTDLMKNIPIEAEEIEELMSENTK
ncbi:aminopeptidase P family protein [Echinicola vietnamensis]|uniref:Xaa-Pro aminopeptidase n=1 Tax=Echinicola vietnamensis (strain DSM 17526 / LMG 23754 / KMM 6221) TaxID=926556 RepID=L0FUC2_ECHVK|nr:aminopeptidase P family protein [Echinicola vietnamensis]AGA76356.1 Xaa-Pro aminopeptidase [Echinicola vietnamensis DSM 17526]